MPQRAKISLKPNVALTARRVLVHGKKLVYVLVAERSIRYRWGRSRILYIGTTRMGGTRVAQSVASRADYILEQHGIRIFHARVITCSARRRVRTWEKLERALLLTFREVFGELPMCNSRGSRMQSRDEFEYFSRERLKAVVRELSDGRA